MMKTILNIITFFVFSPLNGFVFRHQGILKNLTYFVMKNTKNKKKGLVRSVYSFFVTSFTKLLFCAEEARNFRICSFCCWVNAMCSPLLVIYIKDFEEFSLDDIPLVCLFDQIVF